MAGLGPAIHENHPVDPRAKPGDDGLRESFNMDGQRSGATSVDGNNRIDAIVASSAMTVSQPARV
jgi:hypothetical protein